MDAYLQTIQEVPLFDGIKTGELPTILQCLQAKTVQYEKDDYILLAGSHPKYVGVILCGRIQVVKDDITGNRTLITSLGPGGIFGETLCCAGVQESPVSVVAESACTVLLLAFSKILHICSNACVFHGRLIQNMLLLLAKKNLYLQNSLRILSGSSIRERVQRYLEPFANQYGSHFRVPLNREQMAEYLCVDRSALSHALRRMKEDGLIDYRKNEFWITGK